MDKIGKPRGLIHYTTRDEVDGKPKHRLRPRVVLYPVALTIAAGLLVFFLATRSDTDVTVLRGIGAPFAFEPDGRIVNQIRIRVTNRKSNGRDYRISLLGADGAQMIAPENPLTVAPGELRTTSLFVVSPRPLFHDGERKVAFRLVDDHGFTHDFPYTLVGPDHDDGPGKNPEQPR
jgi:polyferredoxin